MVGQNCKNSRCAGAISLYKRRFWSITDLVGITTRKKPYTGSLLITIASDFTGLLAQ
ncbi:hypothetical protein LX87_05420 [Larkinella arboricola]|uniref:Uncharacterized protein n=1 Tax=Larkinella arboricola TaxID=643671 RepID=A0A327WKZ2_LARAB|nr:hypothetical protein LX87_05420 [Larkinella arboricola]